MKILEQLKQDLEKVVRELEIRHLIVSEKAKHFVKLFGFELSQTETAIELSQNIQQLLLEQLPPQWLNPRWYFSDSRLIRDKLLSILVQEPYRFLNLLIKTQAENQKEISELRAERALLKQQIEEVSGMTQEAFSSLSIQLRAYQERFERDQQRVQGLNKALDVQIEKNEELKIEISALNTELKTRREQFNEQEDILSLMSRLSVHPEFSRALKESGLSKAEQKILCSYFECGDETDIHPKTNGAHPPVHTSA